MANSSWVVTSQTPDQYDFTNPGNPVLGVIVRFQTSNGNDSSVFISNAHYPNVKFVRTAIQAKANVVDEIGALASGM